jgi:hypothetical protein
VPIIRERLKEGLPRIALALRRRSHAPADECGEPTEGKDANGIPRSSLLTALVTAANLIVFGVGHAWAQPQSAMISPEQAAHAPASSTYRLTLEQARQQVLSNSKLLKLAALNVQSKGHATSAARADFFPKIVGNTVYLHF